MVTLGDAMTHLRLRAYGPSEGGAVELFDQEIESEVESMIAAAVDHLSSIDVDMSADPLPPALHHAVLLLVGHFYENREATNTEQARFTPLGVDRLIAPFRSISL